MVNTIHTSLTEWHCKYIAKYRKIYEYVEKKIALAATSDACKNLYETIVLCFNKLRQKVVSLNSHSGFLGDIFMWNFIKMSIVYHKKQRASNEASIFDNSWKNFMGMSVELYRLYSYCKYICKTYNTVYDKMQY